MITEGKWEAAEHLSDNKLNMYWILCENKPPVIAKVLLGGRKPDEVKANARLIASAPDLLAACKKAKQAIESESVLSLGFAICSLDEAIEKAEDK